MADWVRVVVHCSDSTWGSAAEIRKWHTGKGWSDIGYHYVIGNGHQKSNYFLPSYDGCVEVGRLIDGDLYAESDEQGAHAYGFNSTSIGICLIGKSEFTPRQIGSLFHLLSDISYRFKILDENIFGHYELDPKKTCPNVDMNHIRYLLTKLKKD